MLKLLKKNPGILSLLNLGVILEKSFFNTVHCGRLKRFLLNDKMILLGLFLSSALFSPVFSQNVLTLEEALKLAKQQNLRLLQQQKNQESADLEKQIQNVSRLPVLNLSFSSTYLTELNEIDLSKTGQFIDQKVQLGGHDRSELLVSLQQPVFTGFRLKSQVELAQNARLSEQAKLEILSDEIFHKVYLIFYQSQNLNNQQKILQTSLKRLNIQLQNIRNLFNAAQVMAFDTLQVYNQTLAIRIELEKNLLNKRLVNLQLGRLLDLKEKTIIAELQLQKPGNQLENLVLLKETALQKRPELEGIRLAKAGTGLQQKLARSTYFPNVYALGNFHYAKPGLDPVTDAWMNYFSVGVNLQWNLWRWGGDQKQIEKVKVTANRLSLEESELRQTIQYQVEESYENLNFGLEQLRLAEELRAQQEERYRIVSVQHQNDLATTNDLVTAEADLTSAELQTHLALVQYYIYWADLQRAVGTIADNIQ